MSERAAVEAFLAEVVAGMGTTTASSELTVDPVRAAEIVRTLTPVAAEDRGSGALRVVVNGRRVDIGVRSSRREWAVVCSIDADGVHAASVFEKPVPFAGVDGGRAVVLNGPSSAGKSTTMAALVERATTPWVAFDELSFGTVAPRFLIWPDAAPNLRPGFVAGMTALALAGNQIVTTGGARSTLAPLLEAVPTLVVALDCPLEVRVDRQSRRTDRWGGLTEDDGAVHEGWAYDVRYDTSRMSADAVAEAILAQLA